jgi:hypothetical protein
LLNIGNQVETVYSLPPTDRWTDRNHELISRLAPSPLCELLPRQLVRSTAYNRLCVAYELAQEHRDAPIRDIAWIPAKNIL